MTNEEYWFWLCNIKNMGHSKMEKLIEVFENPENIYYASKNMLLKTDGIKEEDARNIIKSKSEFDVSANLAKLKKRNTRFIYYGDKNYPKKLIPYEHKPFCLFVRGEMPSADIPTVAVVGARNCTSYGKSMAVETAYDLAAAGVQIISGMAKGIDSYGHKGALNAGGRTYAVLGCGIDICYPRENIELYTDIEDRGGLISEYIPGTPPFAWQFPQRNRIISGLADYILIIEAKESSGSLITVEWALEQGKDIFAVPGRASDEASRGCNNLIKAGAAIVTSAKDILEEMGIDTDKKQKVKKIDNTLEKDFQVVYSCVDLSLKHIRTIIEETGYNYETVSEILLKLQMMNMITEPVKDYYLKNV